MKKTIITFVFLMSFKVFLAQNQNWFIETSVFRNNYQIKDMQKFLSIHHQSDINQFKLRLLSENNSIHVCKNCNFLN